MPQSRTIYPAPSSYLNHRANGRIKQLFTQKIADFAESIILLPILSLGMYEFPSETHTQAIATELVQAQVTRGPWADAQKALQYLARNCSQGKLPPETIIRDLRTAANEYSVVAGTVPSSMPAELEAWLKDRFHVATGLYLLFGLLKAASLKPTNEQEPLVKSTIVTYCGPLLKQIESDILSNPAKQVDDYLTNSGADYGNISARMFASSYPKLATARQTMMLEKAAILMKSNLDLKDVKLAKKKPSTIYRPADQANKENDANSQAEPNVSIPVIIPAKKEPLDKIMKELDKLIGLKELKAQVKSMTNLLRIQAARKEAGLPVPSMTHHMVFIGAPGTGKTTIARLLAKIYHSLGLLESGQLIEVARQDLVAEYVGQTAIKTNRVIDMAMGSTILLDECYSLAPEGGGRDFGSEAIETLLKRMEDDRDKFIVIVTGYPKEMQRFLDANSGLRSRFDETLVFPDYDDKELFSIMKLIAKEGQYKLSVAAQAKIKRILLEMITNKDDKFGNARAARKLFEDLITEQANRLAAVKKPTKTQLMSIQGVDVDAVIKSRKDYNKTSYN